MTQIPEESRARVKHRDQYACRRCGQKGSDWHHRRSRRIRDDHTHCACNGIWLCHPCHMWAHAHVAEAREAGLIVSAYEENPATVPVTSGRTVEYQDCAGNLTIRPRNTLHLLAEKIGNARGSFASRPHVPGYGAAH